MFTRLGFENACLIAWKSLLFQQAFSKPCLVNWISRRESGFLFYQFTYWFNLQTGFYDLIVNFASIQYHLHDLKSAISCWPDKDKSAVRQTTIIRLRSNNTVNIRGN